jgi:radical SAM protein with 4Fe4S-binding SPASM domain
MALLKELVLELTERCPQNCLHCSSASGPLRHEQLAPAVALRLVREAHELGAEKVSFGGGEPFESPILVEVVREVSSLGMAAQVFTCGAVGFEGGLAPLGDDAIRALAAMPSVEFIFSIHGCDAGRAMADGVPCELNFVPLKPNAAQIGGLATLAARMGMHRVSVLRFVPQGRGLENRDLLELSAAEEDDLIESIVALREKHGLEIRTGSPFNGIAPGNAVPCRAGSSKLVVQADGNVLPCEVFKGQDVRNWGLCASTMALDEILDSRPLVALRQQVERNSCLSCPVHSALRAGLVGGEHEQLSEGALRARAG